MGYHLFVIVYDHFEVLALQTLKRKGYGPTHKERTNHLRIKWPFPQLLGLRRKHWQQKGLVLTIVLKSGALGLIHSKESGAVAPTLTLHQYLHEKCF